MKIIIIVIQVVFLAITICGMVKFWQSHDGWEDESTQLKKLPRLVSDGIFTIIFGQFTIIAHLAAGYL